MSGGLMSGGRMSGGLKSYDHEYRVPAKLHTEMHWQYWPSSLC